MIHRFRTHNFTLPPRQSYNNILNKPKLFPVVVGAGESCFGGRGSPPAGRWREEGPGGGALGFPPPGPTHSLPPGAPTPRLADPGLARARPGWESGCGDGKDGSPPRAAPPSAPGEAGGRAPEAAEGARRGHGGAAGAAGHGRERLGKVGPGGQGRGGATGRGRRPNPAPLRVPVATEDPRGIPLRFAVN